MALRTGTSGADKFGIILVSVQSVVMIAIKTLTRKIHLKIQTVIIIVGCYRCAIESVPSAEVQFIDIVNYLDWALWIILWIPGDYIESNRFQWIL